MKNAIQIGEKVMVRNVLKMLRETGARRFQDFEGKVLTVYSCPLGFYGQIETSEGIRNYDTIVHQISIINGKGFAEDNDTPKR